MLSSDARQKLRQLLPPGMVATKQWLLSQGLGLHFVDNAVRSNTLLSLSPGVFTVLDTRVNWQGIVASLQRMSLQPVHVGGLTALGMAGLAHYLPQSSPRHIKLYCANPLPRWLSRLPPETAFTWPVFSWHSTRRLWPDEIMSGTAFIREDEWREGLPPVQFSCPEKALLEVISDIPELISFEHADQLMQGGHNLSPRKLDTLLKSCRSVKVKRLFLWLAARHHHAWFNHLKPDSYHLGTGKRVVAHQGRLDNTWQITVPKEM
ncbi:MAG: type IV toxin-antitoxin system AbiEi family antitoxin domain-containing protein [Enterobacteriaceae bacterium]